MRRRAPRLFSAAVQLVSSPPVPLAAADIERRLDAVRRVFDHVSLFVAPSAALGDEYLALGLPPDKLRVADYGFVPLDRRRRQRGSTLRIGFVGTLAWHKGAHVLLEAVRGLPLARLDVRLAGDVHVFPDYVADLRRLAEGLPVTFTGRFERADAARIYATLDVLVVPSLWPENSPLVIHEAFMAGVPVVGARIGGIPELVRDGATGLLCDAGSATALSDALRMLVDEPDRVREFRARILSAPGVKTIADEALEWERTYAEVLGRRTAPPFTT